MLKFIQKQDRGYIIANVDPKSIESVDERMSPTGKLIRMTLTTKSGRTVTIPAKNEDEINSVRKEFKLECPKEECPVEKAEKKVTKKKASKRKTSKKKAAKSVEEKSDEGA